MFGLFKKNKKVSDNNNEEEIIFYSPVDGEIKDLSLVKDEVFSRKMVGEGVAIVPKTNKIFSPVKDGKINVAFPTGHAFGIEFNVKKELISVLIHIGLDTVELNGTGFTSKVKVEDKVNLGTELCEVDFEKIEESKKITDVIVLVVNESLKNYVVVTHVKGIVKKGDPIFKLVKKQ